MVDFVVNDIWKTHFKPVINNLKVSFIVINLYEVKIKLANRQNKSNFRQRFIKSFILL